MNIYVGNLNYRLKEEELREAFEAIGAVDSVKLVKDRETGRAKGFGFVEMPNDEEALAAIEKLNGTEVGGRQMVVKEARPKNQD
jgi:RNA recognition motif-containing protein